MSQTETSVKSIEIIGIGLVTGLPSTVTLVPAVLDSGVRFTLNGVTIPASPEFVADANRGVTLAKDGQMLVLVEHFLAACGMTGFLDWDVEIQGAPELPILDGSAIDWVKPIQSLNLPHAPKKLISLMQSISFIHPERSHVQCHALPHESGLKVTCLVDFPHPELEKRWLSFDFSQPDFDCLEAIAPARTFGFVSELPALQAQGLAKGVSLDNTLGLTEEGGYTTTLRMPDECIRHKILDFIGDMTLCGIPVLRMNAHFILMHSGHQSHIEFGKLLQKSFA